VTTCRFVALYESFGETCIFHLKGTRSVMQMEAMDTSVILVSTHPNTWPHIPQNLIMVVVILDEYCCICDVLKIFYNMKTQKSFKHLLERIPDPDKLKLHIDNFNNN
jgi:hypothetical protein